MNLKLAPPEPWVKIETELKYFDRYRLVKLDAGRIIRVYIDESVGPLRGRWSTSRRPAPRTGDSHCCPRTHPGDDTVIPTSLSLPV